MKFNIKQVEDTGEETDFHCSEHKKAVSNEEL